MKKRLLSLLVFSLMICTLLAAVVSADARPPRLVDNADLLNESQAETISKRLDEISEKYEFDVVIVTEKSIGNTSAEAYADDYYDYNGYGYGDDYTGLLLLVTFDELGGIWHISTCGEAIDAFSDSYIDSIGGDIETDLGDSDFASAFITFIDDCDYYINGHINGFPFNTGKNLVISIVVGFIIALISVSSMKGKLKSVRLQKDATTYVKQDSMNITTSRDFYLYRIIDRTAKPKNNSSSTHTSSSGRSHGGGGGRF